MKTDKSDNEVFAEFMGWEKRHNGYMCPNLYPSPTNTGETEMDADWFRFEESFDWLMPVWHKFRDMKFKDEFVRTMYNDYCLRIAYNLAWEEITPVHKLLVRAINWYNQLTRLQKETP